MCARSVSCDSSENIAAHLGECERQTGVGDSVHCWSGVDQGYPGMSDQSPLLQQECRVRKGFRKILRILHNTWWSSFSPQEQQVLRDETRSIQLSEMYFSTKQYLTPCLPAQLSLNQGSEVGGGQSFPQRLHLIFQCPLEGFKTSSGVKSKITESRYTTTDAQSGLLLIGRDLG